MELDTRNALNMLTFQTWITHEIRKILSKGDIPCVG